MSSLNNMFWMTDFPALNQSAGTKNMPLVYLDSASTSLKPTATIQAVTDFYAHHGGSAGRGSHSLALFSDQMVENTRSQILRFVGADASEYDAIFTSGATESLNLIANVLTLTHHQNIVLTRAEHHANIVPWQIKMQKLDGVKIRYAEVLPTGEINLNQMLELVDADTAILSLTHMSNVTGILTDLSFVGELKRKYPKLVVVVDSCQAVAHTPLNVDQIDADFVAFSAHKVYGPSGVGVLVGRKSLLAKYPPYKGGGGMVELVEDDTTSYMPSPSKFEAGSMNAPNIAGFGAALKFVEDVGWNTIMQREKSVTEHLLAVVSDISGVNILGNSQKRSGILAFNINNIHPHDLGQFLDEAGIVVRTGHHCAQLIHRALGVQSSTRASIGVYTTENDVQKLASAITDAKKFFKLL